MADNFTWEESPSGIEFASDDVSGVHYQVVKLAVGASDAASLVSGTSRLPVGSRATGVTPVKVQVAYTASQTAATVYTPTSGKKLVVTHIVVSASGAGTIKLFDNSDTSANSWSPILSLAANGSWDAHFSDNAPLVMSANDNVLKYTSGSGAAGSIWLFGWEE
jgi:hypothetical protein